MDRGAWRATVHGVARVRHDSATKERERGRERAMVSVYVLVGCVGGEE